MPKKRTPKDQARLYTVAQRNRVRAEPAPDAIVKDVTTQLRELRIEQARNRQRSRLPKSEPTELMSSLGFTPLNRTQNESSTSSMSSRRTPGPPPPRCWSEQIPQ